MPSASQSQSISLSQASPSRHPPSLPHELLLLAESQWLFTESELLRTPSILNGLSPSKERENRGKGVSFISQVGIMLRLPQITLATASVFLHRFYMRWSMVKPKPPNGGPQEPEMHYYSVAATCLFLATKVEENCRKMKEIVVACVRVAQKDPSKFVDEQDKEYWRWRDTLLQMEDVLLEAICFDLSVEPPYNILSKFLLRFKKDDKRLRNAASAFLNDSYLTMLCLLFPSRTIAASALYAAAKHCGVKFQDKLGKPWWEEVGVELKHIRRACNYLADIYENNPLKGGTDNGIHERTPEDGDEWLAKTREISEVGEVEVGGQERDTAELALSNAGSDVSRKRRRDEREEVDANGHGVGANRLEKPNGLGASQDELHNDTSWGGEIPESSNGKRQRFEGESNGIGALAPPLTINGTAGVKHEHPGSYDSKPAEDVSEEGEVEP